jgi:hypothetical protein
MIKTTKEKEAGPTCKCAISNHKQSLSQFATFNDIKDFLILSFALL